MFTVPPPSNVGLITVTLNKNRPLRGEEMVRKFHQLGRDGAGILTLRFQLYPSRLGAREHWLPRAGCSVATRPEVIYALASQFRPTSMQGLMGCVVVLFFVVVNLKEKLKPKEIIFTWATQISAQVPQTGTLRAVCMGQVSERVNRRLF